MSNQTDFFIKMLPYAQASAKTLNMPVSVILAQWGIESAYGTSKVSKDYNNFSGIMYTENADYKGRKSSQGTYFAGFNTIGRWAEDYTRIMSMNKYGYKEVREAVSVTDTVLALSKSSYDATHYDGGQKILNVINNYDLTKYDSFKSVLPTSLGASGTFTLPSGIKAELDKGGIPTIGFLLMGFLGFLLVIKR